MASGGYTSPNAAAMASLITKTNPTVTAPVVGSIYSIASGGTTSVSATPALG